MRDSKYVLCIHQTMHSSAYAAICALASHCYDEDGNVLLPIMEKMAEQGEKPMDGTVRRQLYALLKIVIEKWPPACVKGRMPQLKEVSKARPIHPASCRRVRLTVCGACLLFLPLSDW